MSTVHTPQRLAVQRSVTGLVIALALVACSSPQQQSESSTVAATPEPRVQSYLAMTPPALIGPEWQVEEVGGQAVLADTRLTLRFDNAGRVAGSAGCNRYTASYSAASVLEIGAAAATKKACAGPVMEQESRFLRMLPEVRSYVLDASGALLLQSSTGEGLRARPQQAASGS